MGTTNRVPISDVDRERGDSHNILAVVMSVTEDGFYRLGTTESILKQRYGRSHFILWYKNLIRIEDIHDHKFPIQLHLLGGSD